VAPAAAATDGGQSHGWWPEWILYICIFIGYAVGVKLQMLQFDPACNPFSSGSPDFRQPKPVNADQDFDRRSLALRAN
jgi:hypothetical protein